MPRAWIVWIAAWAIVVTILFIPYTIQEMRSLRMKSYLRLVVLGLVFAAVLGLFLGFLKPPKAAARDVGQWEESDPSIREWYRSLMQPDNPVASCCGPADSYWADDIRVRDGKVYARITDDRPDEPLGRPHIPNGTEFEIPNHKLKHDAGNPTGHALLFVTSMGHVWCFVQNTGI